MHDETRMSIFYISVRQESNTFAPATIANKDIRTTNTSKMLLFDRIVYGMMDESPRNFPLPLHKGKRCVLVSTSTTPWPLNILMHQSRGAIRAMKEICRYSGFKVVATIEKGGTRHNTTLAEREKNRCRKAVRKLLK